MAKRNVNYDVFCNPNTVQTALLNLRNAFNTLNKSKLKAGGINKFRYQPSAINKHGQPVAYGEKNFQRRLYMELNNSKVPITPKQKKAIQWVECELELTGGKGQSLRVDLLGWSNFEDEEMTVVAELKYGKSSDDPFYAYEEGLKYCHMLFEQRNSLLSSKRYHSNSHAITNANFINANGAAFNKFALLVIANSQYWQYWNNEIQNKCSIPSQQYKNRIKTFCNTLSAETNQIFPYIEHVAFLSVEETNPNGFYAPIADKKIFLWSNIIK